MRKPNQTSFRALTTILLGILSFLIIPSILFAGEICVDGAGDSEWDGTYNNDDNSNIYVKDSTHYIVFDSFGNSWGFFESSDGSGSPAYQSSDSTGPVGGTFFEVIGASPVPTFTDGACASPSPSPSPSVSPSPSPSPSPSASPTPKGILPKSVCLNVSDETSEVYSGTYNLEKGEVFSDNFEYKHASNPQITITKTIDDDVIADVDIRKGFGSGYHNRLVKGFEELIVTGRYHSHITLRTGSILYCDEDEMSDDIFITEGACEEVDNRIVSLPSTTITGKVLGTFSEQTSADTEEIPALVPGVTYAILFEGLASDDADTNTPIGFAVANDSGEYAFTGVYPGEYHIVFAGADTEYTPSKVDVTVIGSGSVTADDTTLSRVVYNDEGCTVESTSDEMSAVNVALVKFRGDIIRQLTKMKSLASSKLKGKKQNRILKRISDSEDKVNEYYKDILEIAEKYPRQIRVNCPVENTCEKSNLKTEKTSLVKTLRRMSKLEKRMVKAIRPATKKSKKQKKIVRRRSKKAKRSMRKSLNAAKKLPKSHDVCPERE